MKKILLSFLIVPLTVLGAMAAGHIVTITTTSNVLCFGTCSGSVTASVSGGVGPFTYSWSSGGTSATETGLCAGNDTVYCTDNSDMSVAIAIVTITQPPLLTVGAGGSSVCGGGCTTLSAGASGGTPPYTFSWSGGLFGPSPTACPASTTTYTVTVTDQNGCVATGTRTVTVMALPVVTVNSPTICSGTTATLTGGGASFYVWSTSATTVSINVSPATTTSYTVTGTAPTGCTASAVSTVTVTPTPTATVPVSATYCAGATVPIGIFSCPTCSPGPGNFTWTNSTTAIGLAASGISSVPSFTAMNTGSTPITSTITVTPTYAGCPGTPNTYTITVDPTPTVTVPSTYTACFGGCVTMTASGTGGASFVWNPSSGLSSIIIANPTACPATSMTYTITAYIGGCTANAITVVTLGGPITSGITSTNTTGCVTCDGSLAATPTGGTSPYVYNWSTGATTPAVVSTCAGTYQVTITDAAGCTITDSTTIFTNDDVMANFTMVPDSTDPYNFFAFNTSTGGGLSYSWYWSDGTPDPGTANPSHYYPALGTYNICLMVSNALCGADTLCQDLAVTGVSSPCNALFNIADDTLNPDPNAHYVYNLSYGATLTYLWDFGDGTTSTSATPSHVYAGTGPYLLCLSIDNGAGCTDMFCDSLISADSINRSSGTMQFVVYDVPTFYSTATGIANAVRTDNVTIAPNPFNETTIFTVNSNEIYSFELTDVLGKKVKSKNGISEKQFEVSRDGLENGIYFYKIYTSGSIIGIGKVVIK